MVLIQILKANGLLYLKAPGMTDLQIASKDLEYEKTKEISSKVIDVNVKIIVCGKVYDEWVSTFLIGKYVNKIQSYDIAKIKNFKDFLYK